MGIQFAWSTVAPPSHLSTTGGLILRCLDGREILVAVRRFRLGEVIFTFDHATWRGRRDSVTVDDAFGRPVYDPLLARVARVALSGAANCRADFDLMALIARRAISAGETLRLDQPALGPRSEPLA
jgi:hypothetical protein